MVLKVVEVKGLIIEIAQMYQEKRDELAKLDAVIGDGDHGISMARGAKEGERIINDSQDNLPVNEYFKMYGRALIDKIGGAMGPLFGTIFTEFGKCSKGEETFTKEAFVQSIENSTNKIMEFGGAKLNDKTMVDAMMPTVVATKKALSENKNFTEITEIAMKSAKQGMENTIPLQARKGRSKFLQEKSIGHQDAGATSYYYLMKKINEYIERI